MTTGPPDFTYMGFSLGRWEGDSLIVETNMFNGKNWFDRAGNYHSDQLHVDRDADAPDAECDPLRGNDRRSRGLH